jgi:DNA topoisomerase-1
MKTLLIVESPAKAKTIEKLLGINYIVKSSFGHIRDLVKDKNDFGIDIQNNFNPKYKIMATRTKQIKDIQDVMKTIDRVFLAADEDREGEAIAWHCAIVFKIPLDELNRITFNEITKNALEKAVSNPRKIDLAMVNSQQARRILDRLVGFELSPILWKHVKPELSAGRVQSVCLKIITDKENDINNFLDNKFYKTIGIFNTNIIGTLNKLFEKEQEALDFLESAKSSIYSIENIETKRNEKRPPPPYITSSIQQDVGNRYGIPAKKIMSILQTLYEGGLITYHRTDSTNLSSFAMDEIKKYISTHIGENYLHPRLYKTKSKCAQEAHEAIRPTYFNKIELDDNFTDLDKKVYGLIWKRTVASQMSAYVYDAITVTINILNNISNNISNNIPNNNELKFISKSEKAIFDGYKKIYQEVVDKNDDEDDILLNDNIFANLKIGTTLDLNKITSTEKYKNPPPRYTEASLIKKMELLGIGRPSTYANIIDTILDRNYVEKKDVDGKKVDTCEFTYVNKKDTNKDTNKDSKNEITKKVIKISIGAEKKKMIPTEIGKITLEFLEKNFQDIVNYGFTNSMENKLDIIASGTLEWTQAVSEFYSMFHPKVELLNSTPSQKSVNNKKRIVGMNDNGKNIYAYIAKYGPVLQIGEDNDKEKKYIKLDEKFNVETVTLDDIQSMIKFPKHLGKHKESDIVIKNGPYGYYLVYNGKNYKIPTEFNELLTLEEAIQCIENTYIKEHVDPDTSGISNDNNTETIQSVNKNVKSIGDYHIKIGKYGPYILYNGKFYKIKNEYVPENLTEEDCVKIVGVNNIKNDNDSNNKSKPVKKTISKKTTKK